MLPHGGPERPPSPPSIALAWAESAYSTQDSPMVGRDRLSFGTVRQLRSAAGWFETTFRLVSEGGDWTCEERSEKLHKETVLSTQDLILNRFTKGLKARVGEDAEPSWALLDRHVREFDKYFDDQYRRASTPQQERNWALAGLVNLTLWLAWLRSREMFDLRWMDVDCILPKDGPVHGLPVNVGCLNFRLTEQTKSNRTKRADVPVAYTTRSGYQIGKWYQRAKRHRNSNTEPANDPSLLFTHQDGTPWDSYYFRTTYLYPLLYKLRMDGDPALRPLDGQGDNTIPFKYKSLHAYRRGGRSHVDILREPRYNRRKATPIEIYEHGRWRVARSSESAPTMYREWTLWDRLQITMYCS